MMTSEAIKLYHASLDEIREPDIYRGRKNADFGQSFYLTPEQALKLLDSGPVYTQAALKSARALRQLKWIGAQKITDIGHYRALRKEEEKVFLEIFSGKLDEMFTDD